LTEIRHLDLPCEFTPPRTKALWEKRAGALREHILVSMGLWPMPDKCPLNARIFGRLERDGYAIEKVYFESLPGFFVTGNLYRPLRASGPCPGILNPHGHWKDGRLADEPAGSVIGRCIHFARLGCVAFAWDMIGYNDSRQVGHRAFAGDREQLWGISILGLQLWNSIRSVDFLLSLPDVDPARIACTGASGGGTQTFFLTAVDDRVMLSAPVNMISGHMQGGCLCENGPSVRIGTNNIEIGALMAPRPLLMVSATGDWTVNTPDLEFPAIQAVYRLYGAEDRIRHIQIDAGHNYNKDSRNAVYAWFGRWLFGSNDPERFMERPYTVDPPETMLVFADEPVPGHAVDAEGLVRHATAQFRTQLEKLKPADAKSLRKFRQTMSTAFRAAIGISTPDMEDLVVAPRGRYKGEAYAARQFYLGRQAAGDRIPATWYAPSGAVSGAALIVHPDGRAGLTEQDRRSPGSMIQALLKQGYAVLAIDPFLTGEAGGALETQRYAYFTTYNHTATANRVQDIITAVTYLRQHAGVSSVSLVGLGEAGLWGLLACGIDPHIVRAALDIAQFDSADDQAYLDRLFIPCLRRLGDVKTAATLAAPAALLLHNIGATFETDWIEDMYRLVNAQDRLRLSRRPASGQQIVKWATEGPAGVL
jgi:dienelactone hydrolase